MNVESVLQSNGSNQQDAGSISNRVDNITEAFQRDEVDDTRNDSQMKNDTVEISAEGRQALDQAQNEV